MKLENIISWKIYVAFVLKNVYEISNISVVKFYRKNAYSFPKKKEKKNKKKERKKERKKVKIIHSRKIWNLISQLG